MLPPPIDQGTVLIIGATGGIGRELSRLLSRRVRTLVLVDRYAERLEPLRDELLARNPTLGVLIHRCDVGSPREVDLLLSYLESHFVRVDVLVNNAAVGDRSLYAEERWGRVEEMLRANVWLPALLTHRLLGPMLERGRGGVLNIGSGAAHFILPGSATFAATQRFLDGFSEALRLEVRERGVTVTRVAPGPLWDEGREDVTGEPAPFFSVSLARCAREALAGFERGEALVYPGFGHRWMMRLLPLLPRGFKRALGRLALRGLRRESLLSPQAPPVRAEPPVLLTGEPSPA
ncbi:SDR family NAD(P)-dependent oxidoreductase [Pyxidicoccus fallax]|uniref:SDR family NAD(P)-dependent oxidoreductase n=1 Tax=Pyxidicoccus fallax TaxID=394095 RepID=A0A848LWC5_9BACT|nr:SDR family NAD(P)-dependent oxidoreductase [Pyxidicoccus fallax]NMO22106.1 SDR family NAD(P)-dependent oxidoreductase [Pyxidicoccus fallax]NPC86372.1 SDR family NAD(P)-dependent oxidoreductase [Pyxidicoccus fallax]